MNRAFTKAVFGALAALLLPVVVSAADAVPVANDAFSISLPAGFGDFATQKQQIKSEGGLIDSTSWVSKAATGEAVVVTVNRMPGKILDADKMLSSTRDSLLKTLKANLEDEKKIEGDKPGSSILFRTDSAPPAFLRSRLVVDQDRFYQVLYVGRSAEQRATPEVTALFDSFSIVEPAAAPAAK